MKVKMDFEHFFIFILCTLATLGLTNCEECTKQDDCSCKTSKGTVDLHNIKSLLTIKNGDYEYQFQPCEALTGTCGEEVNKVAVCQRGTVSFDIGNISPVEFHGDPDSNLQATYINGDRKSIFNIKCDKGTKGKLTSINEGPTKTYNFELHTQYACLGSKISTGSVLLIIFFVFLGTYFIAGILFLKFARKAQGAEMVPNYDFWASLPGYIKDGVTFTCRGCKTESSYSQI